MGERQFGSGPTTLVVSAADTEEPPQTKTVESGCKLETNQLMNTKQKILTILALIVFSATGSSFGMIGETREQVLQDAQRHKDTAGIYNVNSATVVVLYRDGSDINHVF